MSKPKGGTPDQSGPVEIPDVISILPLGPVASRSTTPPTPPGAAARFSFSSFPPSPPRATFPGGPRSDHERQLIGAQVSSVPSGRWVCQRPSGVRWVV